MKNDMLDITIISNDEPDDFPLDGKVVFKGQYAKIKMADGTVFSINASDDFRGLEITLKSPGDKTLVVFPKYGNKIQLAAVR